MSGGDLDAELEAFMKTPSSVSRASFILDRFRSAR